MLQPPGRPSGWVMPPDMVREWDPNRRLQPLAIADLLGRALRLYARNFGLLAVITLVAEVPLGLLSEVVSWRIGASIRTLLPNASPGQPVDTASSSLVLVHATAPGGSVAAPASAMDQATAGEVVRLALVDVGLTVCIGLLGVVAVGALVYAAVRRYEGRSVGIADAYRAAFGRLAELVGAMVLQTLAVAGVIVAGIVGLIAVLAAIRPPSLGLSGAQVGLGLVVGCVLLILAVIIGARLSFVVQIVMLEDRGPASSLGRSWALTRSSILRILGGTVLAGLLVWALAFAEQYVATAIGGSLDALSGIDAAIRMLLDSTVTALLVPVTTTFLTLLYLDVRVRRENFDLPPAA